ncbi:hypothetical protein CLU79DRAFT_680229, partial [Phycomyces nitens]
LLVGASLENTPTNRVYQRGQHLFIAWALSQDVSLTEFSLQDLINFVVHQYNAGFGVSTIKTHCTVALKLHLDPNSLHGHDDVRTVFAHLALRAPLLRQTRPSVDLAPTLAHLAGIDSATSTPLAPLSQKTAFLRPSDLSRLQLLSAQVDPSLGALSFDILGPKEWRNGRRIVKTIAIQRHSSLSLCPIWAFCALRDHPHAARAHPPQDLFVKAHHPSVPVQVSTIFSWLRSLMQLSTTKSVSVCSIASTLALEQGMSLDDIVTLGNWSSCKVFQHHYNCNHTLLADFTNVVL